eukprot:7206959-Lingulodinium_polyedra.AAC.1
MTNCPAVAKQLDRLGCGGHRHAETVGTGFLRKRAVYPPALRHAIAKGFAEQRRADAKASSV